MNRLLSRKLEILSITLLLALLMNACGPDEGSRSLSGESPLAAGGAPATLTADELVKIDPELLAVIEWEEAHPGKGREEAAPDNFIFDSDEWVDCIVHLDPNNDEQSARQLIMHHGGRVASELIFSSFVSLSCFMPLDKIKSLAQEEAVTEIFPNRTRLRGNE